MRRDVITVDRTTPLSEVERILTENRIAEVQARIHGTNPADLTRQINHIQAQLTAAARAKTETLAAAKPLDLESLQPSINRLTPTKRKPSSAQSV